MQEKAVGKREQEVNNKVLDRMTKSRSQLLCVRPNVLSAFLLSLIVSPSCLWFPFVLLITHVWLLEGGKVAASLIFRKLLQVVGPLGHRLWRLDDLLHGIIRAQSSNTTAKREMSRA